MLGFSRLGLPLSIISVELGVSLFFLIAGWLNLSCWHFSSDCNNGVSFFWISFLSAAHYGNKNLDTGSIGVSGWSCHVSFSFDLRHIRVMREGAHGHNTTQTMCITLVQINRESISISSFTFP